MTSMILALCLLPAAPQTKQPSDAIARQQVETLERQWLANENDPAALESIFADDFLHVVPQGIITKNEQLTFMRAHPAPKDGTTRRFEDLRVRVFGTAAVATGTVIATTADGKAQKTAFTDVFALRGGRWRAVNAQETPLLK